MDGYVERLKAGGETDQNSDIYKEHIERYKFAAKLIGHNPHTTRLRGKPHTFTVGKFKSDNQENHNKRLVAERNKDKLRGKKVLDIACGAGYGSELLASSGAEEVWGGDIDQQTIKENKDKYSQENLHFRVMDVCDLPFEDKYFDLVVSFETIEHVEDYMGLIKGIGKVLKPGGKLILSTPNKKITKQLGIRNKFHIKEFSAKELMTLLAGNFEQMTMFGQREAEKLSLKQKLIQKTYFIYRKIKWLGFLAKFVSARSKAKIGQEIKGLGNNFEINELPARGGKEYLYLIIVAQRNS